MAAVKQRPLRLHLAWLPKVSFADFPQMWSAVLG